MTRDLTAIFKIEMSENYPLLFGIYKQKMNKYNSFSKKTSLYLRKMTNETYSIEGKFIVLHYLVSV